MTGKEKYLNSSIKAANFLCSVQNKDGSWTKYAYGRIAHSYETRTAWSLLKVFRLTNNNKYLDYALKNLGWAQENMLKNGWFKKNFLLPPNPKIPFTHTISYTAEGFLFSGLILNEERFIKIAKKAIDPLLDFYLRENFLPGTFNSKWMTTDNYSCLTGNAQTSLVWQKLYSFYKDKKYFLAAKKMNHFLKSTQDLQTENLNIKGGIKGSYPIFGDLLPRHGYCRMAYINWGTKFFIDALLEEIKISKKND